MTPATFPRSSTSCSGASTTTGARAEQRAINRGTGPRRGLGLAVYVEKTGLGPFETTHVEARADGRFTVDTGASSMGPGLETVLAQILGDALGLPPDRFDVRHADTATVESGVGTYGSRGTVTAGNAAHQAAAKLIADARARAGELWKVPEGDITLRGGHPLGERPPRQPGRAGGAAEARGGDVVQRDEADLRRLCGGGGAGRRSRHGGHRPAARRGGRRRGPGRQSRADRGPARRRGGLRHRQRAAREPGVRRSGPAPLRHAHGLRAALRARRAARRRLLPGDSRHHESRSGCAGSASAATPVSAPPSPTPSATPSPTSASRSPRCPSRPSACTRPSARHAPESHGSGGSLPMTTQPVRTGGSRGRGPRSNEARTMRVLGSLRCGLFKRMMWPQRHGDRGNPRIQESSERVPPTRR